MSEYPLPALIGRAAREMRKHAEEANAQASLTPEFNRDGTPVGAAEWRELMAWRSSGTDPIGAYGGAWTPAVALAVADWLDIGANPYACIDLAPMVAVARAYLNEPEEAP